jgi:hypothetical protein
MPNCAFCGNEFPAPPTAFVYDEDGQRRPTKRFCSDAHRAAYRRVTRGMHLAQLVEKLGPFVDTAGEDIYNELVTETAWRVNESA